ncbi:putative protein disulfide-isomerase [Helianthus annuus]|nr:putative protein disulfide-isomerase [Helianthus annuus]KAJ0747477.1 putative protein disulfide-isomerase [Helianthus annuus]KAJ0750568.1 putative protein disulfide-isomerase [Helianthus annuus]
MRLPIIILFLVTSAYLSSTADDTKDEFAVVLTLDQSNFTQTLTKHHFLVVDFYAPWSVLLTFTFFLHFYHIINGNK